MKRAVAVEKEQTGWTNNMETIMNKMSEKDSGLKSLIETLEKKYSQEDKGPRPPNISRVIKPAKVST